ncbi:adenine deaminase C-terminal domain-containing protein [Desulfoscipio gibsoniae]|uniref:adenine deaminase n=1 Tax=Desulfoscipio gibsoniae DSM 7213 TaxID=767817 RepID=R4KL48_9FIRM|nr:adenine deaminase C-terminal domain-containing protein [Desulfoscipio gibsoniae]AGL03384.1 adenine deaminase [Desulfoscipio gibsoniae DSM 7213]
MGKTVADMQKIVAVAAGKGAADLYIEGGSLVNVFTGEIYPANIAVFQGKIAYVGNSRKMVGPRTEIIDASGCYLCPGFIEVHTHPWMVYTPATMVEVHLALGTTTFVCDNLFFYAYLGADGFLRIMKALAKLPARLYWVARIMHQTIDPEEPELFSIPNLDKVFMDPHVIKVGEITRWPKLVEGNESVMRRIKLAEERGLGFEGHAAGCSYDKLNAVAAVGVESCHEAITAEEAINRLRLGLWTILRHSSLRRDLPELLRAVTDYKVQTHRLLFSTDGSTPGFLAREGWIEGMVRKAVKVGVEPVTAIQMATINAATYLGLDRKIGAIAPGMHADILLLPDLQNFKPRLVIVGGNVVAADGKCCVSIPEPDWISLGLKAKLPPRELVSNPGLFGVPSDSSAIFPVIEVISAAINRLKERTLESRGGFLERKEDMLYCALVDHRGKWVTNGFVEGFGHMEALAATFTTSYDLLVLGRNRTAMAAAAAAVVDMGGGIALVDGNKDMFKMPLVYGGIMSADPYEVSMETLNTLQEKVRECGYPYHDIIYTLLFLVCDFLPGPRITAGGIIDVKTGQILYPPMPL